MQGDRTGAEAEKWGIAPGYHDVFGSWHAAQPEIVDALIKCLSAGGATPYRGQPSGEQQRVFQGDGGRHWGIAVQLYSLRSVRNWGIGDFTDLVALVRRAAEAGASAIGLNPLHALFLDEDAGVSPYAPSSRTFLNPIYIDVEAVPEFRPLDIANLQNRIETLHVGDLVDYRGVKALKREALRKAYARFRAQGSGQRRADFENFRRERGTALTRFSCFETLRVRYGASWREWPQPWRKPDADAIARLRDEADEECGFHEYLQWIADSQLAQCAAAAKAAAMPIGLYLDIAVGVDPSGADAWSRQDIVLAEVSVGAPPDEFNRAGQNWGLAPFNPHALAQDDFGVFREMLQAAMRYAGAIRIDHVLGLMRLFFIPIGRPASMGTYVRYPFEDLLRVIAEESQRQCCVVIGEDLGTVPEGFRDTLAHWGIWAYRVLLFERGEGGAFKPPQDYPALALATFNTHDLPTFSGWWSGHDLTVKRGLGIDPGETDEAREQARQALGRALELRDFASVAAYLAATPSHLVMVAIEDLLDVADQPNIPGTVDEHPNWRRKLPVALDDWGRVETFQATTEALRQARPRRSSPA